MRSAKQEASWRRFCGVLAGALRMWGRDEAIGEALVELAWEFVSKWVLLDEDEGTMVTKLTQTSRVARFLSLSLSFSRC